MHQRRWTSRLLLPLLPGLIGGAALAIPPRGDLFFDTVDVEVANLEVIVADRDDRPVTGLTIADFAVFVDGQRVEITNFLAVEGRRTVAQAIEGASTGEGGEDEAVDEVEADADRLAVADTQRLNLVVFVDDFNMRPENRNLIFANLRVYLRENLDPRDRIMLVSMNGDIEVSQPFTADVEQIMATLDRLEKQVGSHVRFAAEHRLLLQRLQTARISANPGGSSLGDALRLFEDSMMSAERLASDVENLAEVRHQRTLTSIRALEAFADSLAGLRGRKAILYVSDGLATRSADSLAQAWLNKYEQWVLVQDAEDVRDEVMRLSLLSGSSRHDLTGRFGQLVERASASGVVFYPLSNGSRTIGSAISAEHGGLGPDSGAGPMSSDVVALEQFSLESSLLQLADGTGGIAFTRTTNISGLLARMVGDFETFYSLGYRPPADGGESHHVEVEVARPDVEVRHIGSLRKKDPIEHLKELSLSAVHFGVEDNILGVRLEAGEPTLGEKGHYLLPVMLKIPFQSLLLLPDERVHAGQLSLVVVVRDEKSGGVSEPQTIEVPIRIPNEQIVQAMMGAAAYPLQLEMQPGHKRISFAIRDLLARVDSTVSMEIDVAAPADS